MKKLIAVLLLLLATFAFVSCDDESEDEKDGKTDVAEALDPEMALVFIWQENDNYDEESMNMRIGETEWYKVDYKTASVTKNVEPGEYIPEVWAKKTADSEFEWLYYYEDEADKDDSTIVLEAGKKYEVRLMNDFTVTISEEPVK